MCKLLHHVRLSYRFHWSWFLYLLGLGGHHVWAQRVLGMPGMTVTFLLITFLPSPFCQLLCSSLTNSPCSLLWCSVTMSIQRVLLTLPLCFCLFSPSLAPHPSSAEKSGCFKVNNCKCIMKDGSGVINLNSMGDADGFLGYLKPVSAEDIPVNTEILLSFSPCEPFSQPEDLTGADCTNIAACLIVRYSKAEIHPVWACSVTGSHLATEDFVECLNCADIVTISFTRLTVISLPLEIKVFTQLSSRLVLWTHTNTVLKYWPSHSHWGFNLKQF